jgi:hypothetical protein
MGVYYSFCDVNNCNPQNLTTYDDLAFNALCNRDNTYCEPFCEFYSDEDTSAISSN